MHTRVTEIAAGVHQLTTVVAGSPVAFNQYVVTGEEPLLFHAGMRSMFPSAIEAMGRVTPPESLRWISFGHVEADESGAMNEWLAVAPDSTVVQSVVGCMISLQDLADRPPRALSDGEELDIGGHVLRWIDTPHVPHAWEAGLLYDATTRTLFCGDLFTRLGEFDAASDDDVVGPAMAAEDALPGSQSLHPASGDIIRRLAELEIDTLAPMHAPTFSGDCPQALRNLADDVDRRIAAAEH